MRYTKKNIKHKGKKEKKGKKSQTRKISKSIKGLNTRIKQIVKKITGKPFRGTIGVVSKFVLKETKPYLGKIPIAGNTIVYLFKKGENGLYIVLTTMDNMVDSGGNIVTSAMDGATDLTVLALNLGKK
tara:strand:- start:80 stop:463 length:384 start_codon:yes stop_codon:yes gene_type:complete